MNPCGKKSPEIQYDLGVPFVSQSSINMQRSLRSMYHDASGLSEGYATLDQLAGT